MRISKRRQLVSRTSPRVKIVALALILPALLLRGLIPVGFMPMASDGRLQIALCPGTVDIATFIAQAKDPHAHHHRQDHRAPSCPYALSGSAMPMPAVLAHVLAAVQTDEPPPIAATLVHASAIVRAQLPRGPPIRS